MPRGPPADRDPTLEALKNTSKGLLFVSETEAKREPFVWKGGGELTDGRLRALAKAGEEGTAVETITLDRFFRAVPSDEKAKFQKVAQVLKEQLSGTKVYKVGDEPEK